MVAAVVGLISLVTGGLALARSAGFTNHKEATLLFRRQELTMQS